MIDYGVKFDQHIAKLRANWQSDDKIITATAKLYVKEWNIIKNKSGKLQNRACTQFQCLMRYNIHSSVQCRIYSILSS